MISSRDVDKEQLRELLTRGAEGVFLIEAAIRLVIRHEYWLNNERFLDYVKIYGDPPAGAVIDFKPMMVEFDKDRFGAPDEEAHVLMIAASLCVPYFVCLREVVEGLDLDTIRLVAEAIMYADGFLESVADPRA